GLAGRRTPVWEQVLRQQAVHVHVAALRADVLPAAEQALAVVAGPLRGPPGSLVPRFDVQLEPVDAVQGQAPPGDRVQGRGGVAAAAVRGGDPVADAGPAEVRVPQPETRLADGGAAGRLGDDERVALARGQPLM